MKSWARHGEFLSWPQVGLTFWFAAGAAGAGFSFAAGAGSLARDGWIWVTGALAVPPEVATIAPSANARAA